MSLPVKNLSATFPPPPPAPSAARTADAARPVRSAAAGGYTARLHTALPAIAPLWRRLERDGTATAYQRLDWAENLVAHLADAAKAEPLIVEVVEDASGQPVMLVPLARIRHRGYRVITWLDLDVCDYAAPILAPGIDLTAGQIEAAWTAIRKVLPAADLIRISRIPAEIRGRANPFARLGACRRMEMEASGVAIDGDPETLFDRLSNPSKAKNLAKLRRRLERSGTVRFVVATTPGEVDAIFDAMVAQRETRFSELGRVNLLARPEVKAFYRDGAMAGLSGGPARLAGLSVDGEWIAASYGLVHGGVLHGLILTMAGGPWRTASPGLHIVKEKMRWARAEGLDYFDFTVGTMPYKSDFGVQIRTLDELVEVVSLRGLAVIQATRGAAAAKTWLKGHPEWFGRAQKVRRWLRRKAV